MPSSMFTIPDVLEDPMFPRFWKTSVSVAGRQLRIPDLTTRKGLKRVHKNFDNIHNRLAVAFAAALSSGAMLEMGAILGLMTQMCVDNILRDKLVAKGLAETIGGLLEVESIRALALGSLAVVTQPGASLMVYRAVVTLNAPLARLAVNASDRNTAELIVCIMVHAAQGVLRTPYQPEGAVLDRMCMSMVLPNVLLVLRTPLVSYTLLNHALDLCLMSSRYFAEECRVTESFVPLLASFTRSNDLKVRTLSMCAIIHLSNGEQDVTEVPFYPHTLSEILAQGAPPSISHIVNMSNFDNLDLATIIRASVEYRRTMTSAEKGFDPCILGRRLAILVQRHDLVVGEKQQEPGRNTLHGSGSWVDMFSQCARALRQTGSSQDMDSADVLEMKFLLIRRRAGAAVSLATRAITRNRNLAYGYLVISAASDGEQGLRTARKGLMCSGMTPFIRQQLLWRAVMFGALLGLQLMQEAWTPIGLAQGSLLLVSALEDTHRFVAEVPRDNFWLLPVLNWHIILTILVRGPELSDELLELQDTLLRLQNAADIMHYLRYTISHKQLDSARLRVFNAYKRGAQEWGWLVQRFDDLGDNPDSPHVCYAGHWNGKSELRSNSHLTPTEIHRCSWCSMPSAALRKCRKCGEAMYCDVSCQRSHWSVHKSVCSPY
ncbi:hypothetical protein C8Q74DRAFT_1360822 [Fomes fomentarius]|nr:hypothetical protein C8Q74DRAFT_1360822 [Fomes fomentarius]